jgi:YbbR domain-containing protein
MWIFDNLLYKVVALIVACVLWSAAQGILSVEQRLDVPIEIQNLPPDMLVVRQSAGLINVMIKGSRAAIRSAQKDPIRYPISLDGAKPGSHPFPVLKERFASLRRGAKVLVHSPSTVTIDIEPIVSKRVPVSPDVVGSPEPGYRIAEIGVVPARVEITGAQSVVRRMQKVKTEPVDVDGLTRSVTQDVPLAPGLDHVWRGGEAERGEPVQVTVRIEQEVTDTGDDSGGEE